MTDRIELNRRQVQSAIEYFIDMGYIDELYGDARVYVEILCEFAESKV